MERSSLSSDNNSKQKNQAIHALTRCGGAAIYIPPAKRRRFRKKKKKPDHPLGLRFINYPQNLTNRLATKIQRGDSSHREPFTSHCWGIHDINLVHCSFST